MLPLYLSSLKYPLGSINPVPASKACKKNGGQLCFFPYVCMDDATSCLHLTPRISESVTDSSSEIASAIYNEIKSYKNNPEWIHVQAIYSFHFQAT
jgi:hypothetical protein